MSTPSPAASEAFARFDGVLRFSAARGVADIHVKAGQRPVYRRLGALISRKDEPAFSEADLEGIARMLLPARLAEAYARTGEVTFAHGLVGGGRFRITLLRQRGSAAFVVRVLAPRVVTLRELNLPKQLGNLVLQPSGLVLIAGAAGSGRTSTWTALLEHVNTAAPGARHVVTLEDPIEQPLDDKVAFLRQREVGVDVPDVRAGLRGLGRQDVDVVAVDALPPDALAEALDAAEDCLVLAVVRGAGPADALRLLLEHTPADRRDSLRLRLALRLRGVVSQVLVPGADGKARVPAVEVLLATPHIVELLRTGGDMDGMRTLSEHSRPLGAQTLDQALFELVQHGQIALEAALAAAHAPEQLRARLGSVRSALQAPQDLF